MTLKIQLIKKLKPATLLITFYVMLAFILSACSSANSPMPMPNPIPAPKPSLLIVLAHPDDETWMNGSITKYQQAGYELHIIYAASGNRGSDNTGQNLQGERLAQYRKNELHVALSRLGIDPEIQKNNIQLLAFDDGSLARNSRQLTQIIQLKIQQLQPAKVFTFGPGGITGHSDHIAIGKATSLAHQQANSSATLLYISMSPQRSQQLMNALSHFAVNKYKPGEVVDSKNIIRIDVSEQQQQRISSPKAHKSQFPKAVLDAWKQFVLNNPFEEFVIAR